MRVQKFLSLAKKVSQKGLHRHHKIGCVIARGNKVLGVGHNISKTHPKSPHKFKSIHGEFLAVLNADYEVKGATAYIFRQHKNGTPAMSRPCEDCLAFLIACGIKNVVYSFEGSFKQESI